MAEYTFRLIIIGDAGVGKSCMILRFTEDKFHRDKGSTVGVEYSVKDVEIEDIKIRLQLWDTAGQEQFKSITRSYYRSAAGAIIVFDLTSLESFENVKKWVEATKEDGNPNMSMILCGNKADLKSERVVEASKARTLATEFGIEYIEVSALSNTNIQSAFNTLTYKIYNKVKSGKINLDDQESGVKKATKTLTRKKDVLSVKKKEDDADCC